MKNARIVGALFFLAGTLIAAGWLYTYRVAMVVGHKGFHGKFERTGQFGDQPWWSPYATAAALLVGGVILAWLLPESRSRVKRFANLFSTAVSPSKG